MYKSTKKSVKHVQEKVPVYYYNTSTTVYYCILYILTLTSTSGTSVYWYQYQVPGTLYPCVGKCATQGGQC